MSSWRGWGIAKGCSGGVYAATANSVYRGTGGGVDAAATITRQVGATRETGGGVDAAATITEQVGATRGTGGGVDAAATITCSLFPRTQSATIPNLYNYPLSPKRKPRRIYRRGGVRGARYAHREWT